MPPHHPPGTANERVLTNAAGQVVLKLKTHWRDGTTHLVTSPLEFMQRLAALVPRPRLHVIRFHGVLARNAKLRALAVPLLAPLQPEVAAQEAMSGECEAICAHRRPVRPSRPSCSSGCSKATRSTARTAAHLVRRRMRRLGRRAAARRCKHPDAAEP